MKIVFDSLIFGLQKRGGASNYWIEFFNRFCNDYDCSIYEMNKEKYKNNLFFNVNQNYTKLKETNHSSSFLRIINPPKCDIKESFIFHSTAYRFLKQKNAKNIVTLHDFTHQKFMSFYKKTMNSFLKRRSIKHADGIVCISQNTYNDLLKFYPKAKNKKIAIINNGANYETFHKIENVSLPKKYSSLNEKKYILFVGQRDGYKNFNFMLDVLRNTKDIFLCVIGGNTLDTNLEEYNKIKDRILCFNNVSDEELSILYNLSFCFIYPSLYEGFGIPICEAMNCGCPVIAFNNSSIPEVMNNAGILLDNNNIEKCCEELTNLKDSNYRKSVVEKQLVACKKFSWDRAYNEMIDFYNVVLHND